MIGFMLYYTNERVVVLSHTIFFLASCRLPCRDVNTSDDDDNNTATTITTTRTRPFVATTQVLCLQPFNYAKNMTQQKQPISLNPMVMYRGVHANAVNMGSCTMIQFSVGGRLKQMILGGETRRLSLKEEMMAGIGAGTVSGLAGSPLELIMIQQQRKGLSLGATVADITATPANVYRGFIGCAVREALWTCGYLSIPPVVRRTLMGEYPTCC